MNRSSLRIIFFAAAMASTGMSSAAQPTALGKYARASVVVGMHNSIPPTCVDASTRAINAWNAVGANFSMLPDFFVSTPRAEDQTQEYNEANVTIDDGELSDSRAIMGARVVVDNATKIISNADIRVDRRRIPGNPSNDPTQWQLSCSVASPVPAALIDWQSAILHELGHVVGLNHDANDLACSMYDSLGPGQMVRELCPAEKQAYIDNYKALRITSIPNVTGPRGVNIPAQIHYAGTATFPIQRITKNIACPSGWSCNDGGGTISSTPSPITFNFKCSDTNPQPTSTFRWRTTLTDANGVVTNAVEHTSTCTNTTAAKGTNATPGSVNRVIVTD